jgi:excisionase family DNA binding protein
MNTVAPEKNDSPMLLRVPEAAKKLGISTRTIYMLFSAGKLKPVKIGHSTRIRLTDLQIFIDGL